jgi:starch synthase
MSMPSSQIRVLFVTPECAPLAKVGGLGEISAALPAALRAVSIDARVLLPGYPAVLNALGQARELARLQLFDPPIEVRLLETQLATGVPLIVASSPALYARPGGPYQDEHGEDWSDNALRFGAFSKVAAILGSPSSPIRWRPHVVHCNDWPAALAPLYLHHAPRPRVATVMTVHNLAFQGNFAPELVASLGLPLSSFSVDGLEFHGRMSFLKGGLYYSDAITTVSPNYAREIQSEPLGFGLEGLLHFRRDVLTGILNGIDTAVWNPQTDPYLVRRYSATTLDYKSLNKAPLQRRLNLALEPDVPLLGMVSRLTHQKGIDILLEAAERLIDLPAQLALLGTGERRFGEAVRSLAERYPRRIAAVVGYDEALAHMFEAGIDLFLMPSRFEPCGLTQMYSQCYGTPPIAHATGGLVDTIVDFDPEAPDVPGATGFLFHQLDAATLVSTTARAAKLYRDRDRWRALQQNGMRRDFGWEAAVSRYARVYRQVAQFE